MKKYSLFVAIMAFAAIFFVTNCSSGGDSDEQVADTAITQLEEKMDDIESSDSSGLKSGTAELGSEYTAKYICPMHCKGSGADKAGNCPDCGMEYMENPNFSKK
jgi:hypothetical protein